MTSTELVVHAPGTDLEVIRAALPAVPETLAANYPAMNPDIDLDELMEGALGEGETLQVKDLTLIKVPSLDASTRFMVPDENGERMPARDGIVGIPTAIYPRNSMWVSEDITNKPPDCTSRDGKNGVGLYGPGSAGNASGKCASCPMMKIGSAGKGTPASKCKAQWLLFLLTGAELFPYLVVVPPGSRPNFHEFGSNLVKVGRMGPPRPELGVNGKGRVMRASPWLTSEVRLTLEQAENVKGQGYNRIKFTQIRELEADEVEYINMYGRTVDGMVVTSHERLDEMLAQDGGETAPAGPDGSVLDAEVPLDDLDDEATTSTAR